MVHKLSQRDVAERILDILVKDLGLKPGERVPDHQLKEKYRAGGGDAADIQIGLKFAEAEEWLRYDRATQAWRITELGHEYAL
jgi:hypothetical protein